MLAKYECYNCRNSCPWVFAISISFVIWHSFVEILKCTYKGVQLPFPLHSCLLKAFRANKLYKIPYTVFCLKIVRWVKKINTPLLQKPIFPSSCCFYLFFATKTFMGVRTVFRCDTFQPTSWIQCKDSFFNYRAGTFFGIHQNGIPGLGIISLVILSYI